MKLNEVFGKGWNEGMKERGTKKKDITWAPKHHCRSCGVDKGRKPLASCVEEKHIQYYNRRLTLTPEERERRKVYLKSYRDKDNYPNYRASYMRKWIEEKTKEGRQRHGITVCVCCGSTENITVDHIVPVKRGQGLSERPYVTLMKEPIGNLQGLCLACNDSKADNTNCQIHDKYLGIWNHLPQLDNIEVLN